MTTKKKAQAGARGKGPGASAAACRATAALLHALSHDGGFDFIINMIGETVAAVSAGAGVGLPDNWREPEKGSSVEDLARWFAKVPPTFDPQDATPAKDPTPEDVVTVERIQELVDAIVPEAGCTGNGSDVVALALNELVTTLTSPKTEYAPGEDGDWFAYYVAERAFRKTNHYGGALEDWQGNIFEGVQKKEAAED